MHNVPPDTLSTRDDLRQKAINGLRGNGIVLTEAQYEAICGGIRCGLYPLKSSDAEGRPVYRLSVQDKTIYATWLPGCGAVKKFKVEKFPAVRWPPKAAKDHHRGNGRNHRRVLASRARAEALFWGAGV